MSRLVEGAERQKAPNEIALHIAGRPDLIFVFAMATIPSCVTYAEGVVSVMILVALFVTLSLPKSRFVRIDGVARQGSDTQQCLRTSRSDVCRACPSQARREFAPHYNRLHISQEFAKGGAGSVHRILRFT
jgi:hypothetical protein